MLMPDRCARRVRPNPWRTFEIDACAPDTTRSVVSSMPCNESENLRETKSSKASRIESQRCVDQRALHAQRNGRRISSAQAVRISTANPPERQNAAT